MKKIALLLALLCALPLLFGMTKRSEAQDTPSPYVFTGEVVGKENGMLLVEMDETQYSFGLYDVLTGNETAYYDKNGLPVSEKTVRIGDRIAIEFSGQVMLSYPPKIAARSIKILP